MARRRRTVSERTGKPLSKSTVNQELTYILKMLRVGARKKLVGVVPVVEKFDCSDNVRTGFFEYEDLQKVLPHLPEHWRPVMEVSYITGWRVPTELLTRKWQHVDFEHGVLRLDPGVRADDHTKAKEGREFPFDVVRRLGEILQQQKAKRDELQKRYGIKVPWVFFHYESEKPWSPIQAKVIDALWERPATCAELVKATGHRMASVWAASQALVSAGAVEQTAGRYRLLRAEVIARRGRNTGERLKTYTTSWEKACAAAGIGRTPHDCRRTACNNLIDAGVETEMATELVGWKSREMPKRYHITREPHLRKVASAYGEYLQAKRQAYADGMKTSEAETG